MAEEISKLFTETESTMSFNGSDILSKKDFNNKLYTVNEIRIREEATFINE